MSDYTGGEATENQDASSDPDFATDLGTESGYSSGTDSEYAYASGESHDTAL
jgi:hypothetical protein